MSGESLNNNTEKELQNPDYDKWQEAMKDVEFHGEPEKIEQDKPREDVIETIRDISQREIEHSGEYSIRPKGEIICGSEYIAGQRIGVINNGDKGKIGFGLKLRTSTDEIARIEEQLEGATTRTKIETPDGATLRRGEIRYSDDVKICDAFVLEREGIRILVADDRVANGEIKAATGLIRIEMPVDMGPDDMTRNLGDILEKDLGIPDALGEVSEESERGYKTARYGWQHKISGELTPEQQAEAEKMHREEVFPGYTTFVEEGKHEEYLKEYGEDMRAVHMISMDTGLHTDTLYQILTHGLMSTTERYDRGIISDGRSSTSDLLSGGADNVFTTLTSKIQRESSPFLLVVFKPELFDRTDWHSYADDEFGSTEDETFDKRLSPDELFATRDADDWFPSHNEQMFRTGIGVDYIESVQVASYAAREEAVAELKAMGLTEVGGRPIEEIIVSRYGDPILEDIMEYANSGADSYSVAKSKIEAEIARGKKEELKKSVAGYIKKTVDKDQLKRMARGGIVYKLKTKKEDVDFYAYLQETFDLDYREIYEEALSEERASKEKK